MTLDKRVYVLKAVSKDQRDKWVEALEAVRQWLATYADPRLQKEMQSKLLSEKDMLNRQLQELEYQAQTGDEKLRLEKKIQEELRKAYEQSQQTIKELEDEKFQLIETCDQLKEDNHQKDETIRALLEEKGQLTGTQAEFQIILQKEKETYRLVEEKANELEEELTRCREELKAAQDTITAKDNYMATKKIKHQERERALQKEKEKNTTLETHLNSLREQLQKTNFDIDQKRQEINLMKNTNKRLTDEKTNLENIIKNLKEELQQKTDYYSVHMGDHRALNTKIEELENTLNQKNEGIAKLQNESKVMKTKIEELEKLLQTSEKLSETETIDLKAKLQASELEQQRMADIIKSLTSEKANLAQRVKELEENIFKRDEGSKTSEQEFKRKVSDLEQATVELQTKNAEYEAKLQELEVQRAEIQNQKNEVEKYYTTTLGDFRTIYSDLLQIIPSTLTSADSAAVEKELLGQLKDVTKGVNDLQFAQASYEKLKQCIKSLQDQLAKEKQETKIVAGKLQFEINDLKKRLEQQKSLKLAADSELEKQKLASNTKLASMNEQIEKFSLNYNSQVKNLFVSTQPTRRTSETNHRHSTCGITVPLDTFLKDVPSLKSVVDTYNFLHEYVRKEVESLKAKVLEKTEQNHALQEKVNQAEEQANKLAERNRELMQSQEGDQKTVFKVLSYVDQTGKILSFLLKDLFTLNTGKSAHGEFLNRLKPFAEAHREFEFAREIYQAVDYHIGEFRKRIDQLNDEHHKNVEAITKETSTRVEDLKQKVKFLTDRNAEMSRQNEEMHKAYKQSQEQSKEKDLIYQELDERYNGILDFIDVFGRVTKDLLTSSLSERAKTDYHKIIKAQSERIPQFKKLYLLFMQSQEIVEKKEADIEKLRQEYVGEIESLTSKNNELTDKNKRLSDQIISLKTVIENQVQGLKNLEVDVIGFKKILQKVEEAGTLLFFLIKEVYLGTQGDVTFFKKKDHLTRLQQLISEVPILKMHEDIFNFTLKITNKYENVKEIMLDQSALSNKQHAVVIDRTKEFISRMEKDSSPGSKGSGAKRVNSASQAKERMTPEKPKKESASNKSSNSKPMQQLDNPGEDPYTRKLNKTPGKGFEQYDPLLEQSNSTDSPQVSYRGLVNKLNKPKSGNSASFAKH